jgi:hypothetical protein
MHYPDDLILVKSQKGNDEVVTRKHGLNPRIRQMLILIDGHRNFSALSKLIGAKETLAYAMALESEGFIARVSVPSTVSVLGGNETVLESALPVMAPLAAPAPNLPTADFATMRHRIERLLHETLGPFADDISVRVEKARTLQDLRDLLQSIVLIVEAVRGKSAAAEFLQKVGKF